MKRFTTALLAAAAIASNTPATEILLAQTPMESVGITEAIAETERFGIQGFEFSDAGRWQITGNGGRFEINRTGAVREVAMAKSGALRPTPIAFIAGDQTVHVVTGFGPTDRKIAAIKTPVEVVDARVVEGHSVSPVYVELMERHGGAAYDRRVLSIHARTGAVLGMARVPLETRFSTKNDLAVDAAGNLVHARIRDGVVEVVRPEFSVTLEPFVPTPATMAIDTERSATAKSVSQIARADIIRAALEFVRPQHTFNRVRLGVPGTCSARDLTGVLRTRMAPRAPDLRDGDLTSALYAYGGSVTNAAFASAWAGNTRHIGDINSTFVVQLPSITGAIPCAAGPAVGIDCSGFGSQVWNSPRFGTSTVTQSAGVDIGPASAARTGDILNVRGHMMVLARPINSGHVWVYESTANNQFDRAVHAIRSMAELSQYRAIRRNGVVGEVREAAVTCSGCSGSGGFVDAAIGQPLTFSMPTTGSSVVSIRWFDDALAGPALNTRQNPDPTVSTAATLVRTYNAASLGVRYITAQTLHADGSITNGRLQVTVRESAPTTCALSTPTLSPLSISASGGTFRVPYTTTPNGCIPAISGTPTWATLAASSTGVTVSVAANPATARSATVSVANRTLTISQSGAASPLLQQLTVLRAGNGVGVVTGPGINCGTDCSEGYNAGVVVTLTATPSAGSTFAGWSGACSGTGPCAISMSAARQVTATFVTSSTCSESEPNNSSGSANPWSSAGCSGFISSSADTDWWGGWVAAGTTIRLRLEVPSQVDYDLELYGPQAGNPNLQLLRSSTLGTGQAETITYIATTSGNFAARVYGFRGAFSTNASYRITRLP